MDVVSLHLVEPAQRPAQPPGSEAIVNTQPRPSAQSEPLVKRNVTMRRSILSVETIGKASNTVTHNPTEVA